MRTAKFGLSILMLLWISPCVRAEVRMPGLFSDNMVIQRNLPVQVWGWADQGATVVVELNGDAASAAADEQGRWSVELPPLREKGPYELIVRQGDELRFTNILAGEVWLCSGQSNMEWIVRNSNNPEEEINNADYPEIRHLLVAKKVSRTPLDDIDAAGWQVCSPETVGDFTAVGYFFARHLHQELGVPIGLVHSSWGGTVCEAWTSGPALKNLADFRPVVERMENLTQNQSGALQAYQEKLQAWEEAYSTAIQAAAAPWHTAAWDDDGWKTMKLPAPWETELGNYDGIAWFRKTINIPATWAGKEATVSLGPIDDEDWTWVNGAQVGQTMNYSAKRNYKIPADKVSAGPMKIAVRVHDTGGNGGIWGDASEMKLTQDGQPEIPLAGDWKYSLGAAMKNLPRRPDPLPFSGPNSPTALYNGMIAPLVNFPIQGAIWYQGESNASRGKQYRELFPTMIEDWRARWQLGDFPFYFVQLANFMAPRAEPGPSAWAELREAQSMTLSLPNTGQAVIIDIGDERDIHPRNKQDVGKRLALNALNTTYGKAVVPAGPAFHEMTIEGDKIRLSFDHIGGGLVAQGGGTLKQFAIAGADKTFRWAEATIEGDQVVVSHPDVAAPTAVRYAWADNPEGCNLYNQAGLPASPFRTDRD